MHRGPQNFVSSPNRSLTTARSPFITDAARTGHDRWWLPSLATREALPTQDDSGTSFTLACIRRGCSTHVHGGTHDVEATFPINQARNGQTAATMSSTVYMAAKTTIHRRRIKPGSSGHRRAIHSGAEIQFGGKPELQRYGG